MTPSPHLFSHLVTDADPDPGAGADTAARIFPYWSFTKTVIAISALRLVEEGRIGLDAPLAGYDFSLRQLLNHRAGLPDYHSLPDYNRAVAADDDPWPADHLLAATLAQGRLFAPGQGWSYSNIGYMLAHDLVAERAGAPFAQIVKAMVCDVIGLDSIELATTRQDFARVHWPGARHYHPGWVYHGCLTGSAADAARLLHGLMTGRLLRAETLGQMMTPHPLGGAIAGRPWTECGYGLGLMIGRWGPSGRAIGHSGGGPFSVNAIYHLPDLKRPVTVASFAEGRDEGVAEIAALDATNRC